MKLKNRIKELFFKRAPNSLRVEHILFELSDEKEDDIVAALEELVSGKFLLNVPELSSDDEIPQRDVYQIDPGYKGRYPIETEIKIGKLRIPRMFDKTSRMIAEDHNLTFMVFNRIIEEAKNEIKKTYNRELKKYWGTIVTIFGLFLAIFSMVNISVKPLYFSSELDLSSSELLMQSLINIVPLAFVLIVFVICLWLIFKSD